MSENISMQTVSTVPSKNIAGKFCFINTFILKLIAIVCMTIDHAGVAFGLIYKNGTYYFSGLMTQDTYEIFRAVGRIAFPIFCYLIVEGLFYTKNVKKYALRLLVFAFISQIPFNLLLYKEPFLAGGNLNVYFTLFLGLLAIAISKTSHQIYKASGNKGYAILEVVVMVCAIVAADLLRTDYGGFGVLIIVIFYLFRGKPLHVFVAMLLSIYFFSSMTEMYALIGLIPLLFHNHKKGPGLKYLFYTYYPAHMVVLYLLCKYIA